MRVCGPRLFFFKKDYVNLKTTLDIFQKICYAFVIGFKILRGVFL
jgi:hypothetical protein